MIQQYSKSYFKSTDLIALKERLSDILKGENRLEEVIKKLKEVNIFNTLQINKLIDDYKDIGKENFINDLLNISLNEFLILYSQINNETKISTLHGVKGDEFDKVMLD